MQPTTDRDTTTWYLIHTKPRQGHIALTNLERQGYTRPAKVDDPLVDLLRTLSQPVPVTIDAASLRKLG
jgi:hypothetical protein